MWQRHDIGNDIVSADAERIGELRQEVFYLRERVVAKESELAALGAMLESFNVRYDLVVGVELARLRELELRIAELALDACPSDEGLQRRVRQLRDDARKARRAVDEALSSTVVNGSDELRRLYRCVCRAVHPDLGVDDDDIAVRQRFMRDAIEAYRSGDLNRLQSILDMTDDLGTDEEDSSTVGTLTRMIDRLKRRLGEIDGELADKGSSVMYTIMVKTLSEDIDAGEESLGFTQDKEAETRLLDEMAEHVRIQIIDAERRLEELQ